MLQQRRKTFREYRNNTIIISNLTRDLYIISVLYTVPVSKGILVELLLSVASNVRSKWERSTSHSQRFRHSRISLNVFNSTKKAKNRELWIHLFCFFCCFSKLISFCVKYVKWFHPDLVETDFFHSVHLVSLWCFTFFFIIFFLSSAEKLIFSCIFFSLVILPSFFFNPNFIFFKTFISKVNDG